MLVDIWGVARGVNTSALKNMGLIRSLLDYWCIIYESTSRLLKKVGHNPVPSFETVLRGHKNNSNTSFTGGIGWKGHNKSHLAQNILKSCQEMEMHRQRVFGQ